MRIVHVVNYFSPKMKYQEYFLAREQVRQGHEVFMVTSERICPFPDYETTVRSMYGERIMTAGTFNEEGIIVHRLPVIKEIGQRVILKGLTKTVRSLQPDLIICHSTVQFHTVSLLFMKGISKVRLIVDEHMLHSDFKNSRAKRLSYMLFGTLFGKRLYRLSEKVVGISDGAIRLLNEYLRIKGDKVQLIPLGVDTDVFRKDDALGQAFRKEIGVQDDELLITYTGKISEHKFVHNIPEALEGYQGRKLFLLFVGNVAAAYEQVFKEALSKCTHPYKHLTAVAHDRLNAVYNASNIAVWPASQTISTIEASACGTPIICSDFLKERYENDNGIGVIPEDVNDLRKALLSLISDDEKRERMGRNGIALIERKMSWRTVSDQFLN